MRSEPPTDPNDSPQAWAELPDGTLELLLQYDFIGLTANVSPDGAGSWAGPITEHSDDGVQPPKQVGTLSLELQSQ
jgi:hypothetical protein